jgi:hypothetical protein
MFENLSKVILTLIRIKSPVERNGQITVRLLTNELASVNEPDARTPKTTGFIVPSKGRSNF